MQIKALSGKKYQFCGSVMVSMRTLIRIPDFMSMHFRVRDFHDLKFYLKDIQINKQTIMLMSLEKNCRAKKVMEGESCNRSKQIVKGNVQRDIKWSEQKRINE